MLTRGLFVFVVLCDLTLSNYGEPYFSVYETAEKIEYDGFPSETHNVVTEDGYILGMHRIPHGRQVRDMSPDRPIVFLMHGLLSASIAFITIGPDYSVAYNLADAGYDVWMGNARGNKNSRYHVRLDPDNANDKFEFFDFSFEEIGMYDVAAMIDYILEFTGRDKLHYIGHSQGGTVFFVLTSMRPEYNEKLTSVHLLAGVGYMEYFPNTELSSTAAMTDIIYSLATGMGIIELFPPNSTEMIPGLDIGFPRSESCTGDPSTSYICETFGLRHILRDDNNSTNSTELPTDFEAGGGSLKQLAHYGQNIRDKRFRRYHRGLFGNLGAYGSTSPPIYNLSLITAKVTMHYTVNDNLLDERDVLAMANDMPNAKVRKVARDTFLHEDFAAAYDAKELVTDYVIQAIKEESGWEGPPSQEDGNDVDIDYGVTVIDNGVTVIDNDVTVIYEPPVTIQPDVIVDPPVGDSASRELSAMFLVGISLFLMLK